MSDREERVRGDFCLETIKHLENIGIRLAGTKGEKTGADWIEERFRELGLSRIQQQEFPCLTFGHSVCELSVGDGSNWRRVNAEPAAHSPSTQGILEGQLVFVEQIPQSAKEVERLLKGKIGLVYASVLFEFEDFKRVMEAVPAALLIVDDKVPFEWTVAVGFPRYWVDFLTCPVVNIPYMAAWEIVRNQEMSVRLELDSFVKEGVSQNVIGEIAGQTDEVVVISGHHDSVANNPGADDNLTGVASVIELARVFADGGAHRTLRFISYGNEEQLSEGARFYAASVQDAENIQLGINIDAVGAWMGKTEVFCNGSRSLRALVERTNRDTGFPGHIITEICPFSDHFPLNTIGVPTVWYYRPTFVAARHFHHSAQETIEVVSPQILEATIRNQVALLEIVANQHPLPFKRAFSMTQRKKLAKFSKDWMGTNI